MSTVVNAGVVFQQADTQQLIEEIDRYLAAVDLFRSENCELTWRPENLPEVAVPPSALITKSLRHGA